MRAVTQLLIACLLGAMSATSATAQAREHIPVRFKRAELADIIDRLAPALGARFIYDATLKGQVTIAVPRPVSKNEAWQLLHAALALKGFAAQPTPAGGYKVVPLRAAGDSDPWTLAAPSPIGESRILTLIPLHEVSVTNVLAVIKPLLDPTTIAIPLPSTNSLILATTERRAAAVISLLRGLDVRDNSELRLRTLRERDATVALDVINARYPEEKALHGRVSAWIDQRTNTLIYRAPPAQRREIARMLDELDQPTEMPGEIHVIALHYADPERLADQLRALATGGGVGLASRSLLSGAALNVVAEPGTQSLIVNAAPEVIALVHDVVAQLDRPAPQVVADVLVQEWAYDEGLELSLIGATVVGSDPIVGIGLQSLEGGFRPQALQDALLIHTINLPHQLQLIANQSGVDSATLQRPHLVLLSGEEQTLFVGNNVPIPVAPSTTGQATNLRNNQTTIERHDVGIELRLRASIGATGATQLDVTLDIENLRSSLTGNVAEVGPTFTQRQLETTTSLLPGQALLIAGATQGVRQMTRTGVPFLMNIPMLGNLFATRSEQGRRARIVIAIQLQALPDSDSLLAHSIERRIAFERAIATRDAIGLPPGSGFALRIASEPSREAAFALARQHESDAHPARVIAWSGQDTEYYDVHLTGYEHILDAADEAYRLSSLGLRSDVIPLGNAASNLQ